MRQALFGFAVSIRARTAKQMCLTPKPILLPPILRDEFPRMSKRALELIC